MKLPKLVLPAPLAKVAAKAGKHSPEICLVLGLGCFVGAVVTAANAGPMAEEIVEDHKRSNLSIERDTLKDDPTYSEQKRGLYLETGKLLARTYAPTALLMGSGTCFILCSYNIMRKRNLALIAAYKTLEAMYDAYRQRVLEDPDAGEAKDTYYRTGAAPKKLEEYDEDGKKKKTKTECIVFDGKQYSQYARFFDESCRAWEKDPTYNLSFVTAQERVANQLLHSRGHLFLNEVYDMLGIPRTTAGSIVGWIAGYGDDYVDFGIFQGNIASRRFVNGYEPVILLDFNVDGIIYDKI